MTSEKPKKAFEARQRGLTWADIAKEVGYVSSTVACFAASSYAARHGLALPKPSDLGERAYKARLDGLSWRDVAKSLRSKPGTVHRAAIMYAARNGLVLPRFYAGVGKQRKPEQNEAILAMLRAGEPQAEVAKQFGLSRQRINQLALKHGLRNAEAGNEKRRAKVVPLLADYGNLEIHRRTGVTSSAIQRLRVEEGVPRPKWRPAAERKPWFKLLGTKPDIQIAQEFGVPFSLVNRARHQAGIPGIRKRASPMNWDEICAFVAKSDWASLSYAGLAEKFGTTKLTMEGYLPQHMKARGFERLMVQEGPRRKTVGWKKGGES